MRKKTIEDLGVLLDEILTFKEQVDRALLLFIIRRASEFDDSYIRKTFYCSFVRSIYSNMQVFRIESLQKQSLLFALKGLDWSSYRLPSYRSRLMMIDMLFQENSQELAEVMFAYDLLHRNTECPLNNEMKRYQPTRTLRNSRFFEVERHSSDITFTLQQMLHVNQPVWEILFGEWAS